MKKKRTLKNRVTCGYILKNRTFDGDPGISHGIHYNDLSISHGVHYRLWTKSEEEEEEEEGPREQPTGAAPNCSTVPWYSLIQCFPI